MDRQLTSRLSPLARPLRRGKSRFDGWTWRFSSTHRDHGILWWAYVERDDLGYLRGELANLADAPATLAFRAGFPAFGGSLRPPACNAASAPCQRTSVGASSFAKIGCSASALQVSSLPTSFALSSLLAVLGELSRARHDEDHTPEMRTSIPSRESGATVPAYSVCLPLLERLWAAGQPAPGVP